MGNAAKGYFGHTPICINVTTLREKFDEDFWNIHDKIKQIPADKKNQIFDSIKNYYIDEKRYYLGVKLKNQIDRDKANHELKKFVKSLEQVMHAYQNFLKSDEDAHLILPALNHGNKAFTIDAFIHDLNRLNHYISKNLSGMLVNQSYDEPLIQLIKNVKVILESEKIKIPKTRSNQYGRLGSATPPQETHLFIHNILCRLSTYDNCIKTYSINTLQNKIQLAISS